MISPKKRFEILKRDGFRCMYCGKTGKDVTLEVDHIIPKSKGGTDDVENLITCCRECNLGKGKTRLDTSELWKDKIYDLSTKIKKDFNIKWNGAKLGQIEKKTYILLCNFIDFMVRYEETPDSLEVLDIVYYLNEYTFAGPNKFPSERGYEEFCKSLEEEFKKGGEFCDKCCENSKEIIIEIIRELIEGVCDDSDWSGPASNDYRLNYLLSRRLMQSLRDVLETKNNIEGAGNKFVCNFNWQGIEFLVIKNTYRKDRLSHFYNGGA